MKSFISRLNVLLMCMAATTSAKALTPTYSTNGTLDMEKLSEIIEELAHRPVYDMSNSKGRRAKRYANDFDGDLLFICPYGQSFSRISSYNSDHHGDRRFSISCAPVVSSYTDCSQTNWVNHFDEAFTYTCPKNFVIAGIGSVHSNNHEDRR
ncbi:hypothetical protein ACEWY4_014167 [Coilia grayii]|uniref:Uncharacterized protein n=1 Tax=Coilia grayii TaxID=363190 RepID=A0ABD1JRK7_9TELE